MLLLLLHAYVAVPHDARSPFDWSCFCYLVHQLQLINFIVAAAAAAAAAGAAGAAAACCGCMLLTLLQLHAAAACSSCMLHAVAAAVAAAAACVCRFMHLLVLRMMLGAPLTGLAIAIQFISCN